MTDIAQTLEQQLDALIAAHGLSSISLTRIARTNGHGSFWAINAQGDGHCGSNAEDRAETPAQGLSVAIADLNRLRAVAIVVPELELAA